MIVIREVHFFQLTNFAYLAKPYEMKRICAMLNKKKIHVEVIIMTPASLNIIFLLDDHATSQNGKNPLCDINEIINPK